MLDIHIDPEACVLCGTCIDICTRRRLSIDENTIRIASEPCNLCGHCKAVCPEDAVTFPGLDNEECVPAPDRTEIPSPDNLLAFFRSRRSMRRYTENAVEREKLAQIIEAGRFAPTGGNRQPLEFAVIETEEILHAVRDRCVEFHAGNAEKLLSALADKEKAGQALTPAELAMQAYSQAWPFRLQLLREGVDTLFYGAPSLIVLHADVEASPGPEIDAGLAAMQMGLMAESLGLGTCYNGFLIGAAQQSSELKGLMQIPEKNLPVVSFTVGYPDVKYERLVSRNPARVVWV